MSERQGDEVPVYLHHVIQAVAALLGVIALIAFAVANNAHFMFR